MNLEEKELDEKNFYRTDFIFYTNGTTKLVDKSKLPNFDYKNLKEVYNLGCHNLEVNILGKVCTTKLYVKNHKVENYKNLIRECQRIKTKRRV